MIAHYRSMAVHRRLHTTFPIVLGILVGLLTCLRSPATAQSMQSVKERLRASLTKLNELNSAKHTTNVQWSYSDSFIAATNEDLKTYLLASLPKIPESIRDMVSIEGLHVATSPDNKLRIWSWDSFTGGSMPDVSMLMEFRA